MASLAAYGLKVLMPRQYVPLNVSSSSSPTSSPTNWSSNDALYPSSCRLPSASVSFSFSVKPLFCPFSLFRPSSLSAHFVVLSRMAGLLLRCWPAWLSSLSSLSSSMACASML